MELSRQQAINDLARIRQVIETASRDEISNKGVLLNSFKANKIIQLVILTLSAILILIEVLSNHTNTRFILISANDTYLATIGLLQSAIFLIVLSAMLYFIVYRASQAAERDFNHFITKNFYYLKNISFLSDLLVKFIVFSLLILAQKPEWVAPLFFIFIGDYLVQGRVFKVPVKISLLAGVLCFIAGITQYMAGSAFLIWPSIGVFLASFLSVCHIIKCEHKVRNLETTTDGL